MTRPDDLSAELEAWLGDGPNAAAPVTGPDAMARVRTTRQRPRWLVSDRGPGDRPARLAPAVAAAALVLAAVIGGYVWSSQPSTGSDPAPPATMPSTSPVTSPGAATDDVLGGHHVTRISIPRAHSIGTGAGSIWVGTRADEPSLLRLDPDSLRLLATIDTDGAVACGQIRELLGAIWSPHCGSGGLKRVDPARDVVTATDRPNLALGAAALDGAIWAAPGSDQAPLVRLDPETAVVRSRFSHPMGWWSATTTADALWAASGPTLSRVDPTTGQESASVDLAVALQFPIDVDGSVWIAQEGGPMVFRVDPVAAVETARIDLGTYVTGGFAVDDAGMLWAATRDGLVSIDPATNEVVERLAMPGGGGEYVAAGFGAVWLTSEWRNEVWRIDL